MKGVGRIYQQSFVDTYAKVAFERFHKTVLNEFYQVAFRKCTL